MANQWKREKPAPGVQDEMKNILGLKWNRVSISLASAKEMEIQMDKATQKEAEKLIFSQDTEK